MIEAFNNLDVLLKGFWMVAIPVTIVFIIQMVLTFMGSDASDGTSADFDGDFDGGDTPFQLFSFRNLMNFLLGFSWTGISFYKIITKFEPIYKIRRVSTPEVSHPICFHNGIILIVTCLKSRVQI